MKALALNPWIYVAALVVLLATAGGAFGAGWLVRGWRCKAAAGTGAAKVERIEDRRDENIDAIATKTAAAVTGAMAGNRSKTDDSATFIRTVYVRPDCQLVPDPIVRELRAATDDANAALGIGVRPEPAGAAPAGP